jgi:hypothetical protein
MHAAYEAAAKRYFGARPLAPTIGAMRRLLLLCVVLVGCGGGDPAPRPDSAAPPAPDAGMAAGHGAEPGRVRVPAADATAPSALVRLAGVEARSGGRAPGTVSLTAPVLRPLAVGRDKQGMGRIRVSVHARIECGSSVTPLIRYYPPPAAERVRVAPGTVVPTRLERRPVVSLRCPSGEPAAAAGTVWADATSAWETEASSAPLRFSYRR